MGPIFRRHDGCDADCLRFDPDPRRQGVPLPRDGRRGPAWRNSDGKAVYDITGIVSRDIGGNVVVVSTTTTISEVTSTMDCVAQANTTAQTLEIKGTGKAATRIAWFDGHELYDVGLMAAA